MAGVLLLGSAGLLDLDVIFVNPTWLAPAVVGGAIMGVGFLLGGYCPGTSVCAAAIGKVDAMAFVGGGLLGIFGFAEIYPKVQKFDDSTFLGPLTVYQSLHMPAGVFAFLLIAIAVFAFRRDDHRPHQATTRPVRSLTASALTLGERVQLPAAATARSRGDRRRARRDR